AILHREILEVPDAKLDPRFVNHPGVVEENGIRFYAGVPLFSEQGLCYGTLCVVDRQPMQLTAPQRELLQKLGKQAVYLMESRVSRQQELTASLSLARLLEFLPDGLITTDINGNIQHVNSIARRWHGIDPGLVPRERWSQYFQLFASNGTDRLPLIDNPLTRVLRGETVRDQELLIRATGQPDRPIVCNAEHLVDAEDRKIGAVVVMRDITAIKHMEKMKDEFVSTVCHELRTPLTSISGALSLVLGGVLGEVPMMMSEMLGVAHQNSQRLAALINDLLDMEKLLAGKMHFEFAPQALIPLLDETLLTLTSYAEPLGVFLQRTGTQPVTVNVDSMRLIQVLTNLLSNACKFSPRGSKVLLDHKIIEDQVEVSIIDQGSGIPESFRERIFQKFSQADSSNNRSKGGTGLGLVICKELIERMHGEIGFESCADKGTRFWFRLPIH
ncbi:MAG: ATP-binding protein, partial [Pseudomonadota bacterium]